MSVKPVLELFLEHVTECLEVSSSNNSFTGIDRDGNVYKFNGDEIVSMNFWAFKPSIFEHLQNKFKEFLDANIHDPKAEFFIPDVIDYLVTNKMATVKVLPTDDEWFGVTYRSDRDRAVANINRLIEQGVYPHKLWS